MGTYPYSELEFHRFRTKFKNVQEYAELTDQFSDYLLCDNFHTFLNFVAFLTFKRITKCHITRGRVEVVKTYG